MKAGRGIVAIVLALLVVSSGPFAGQAQAQTASETTAAPVTAAAPTPAEPAGWTAGDIAEATGRVLVSQIFIIAGIRKIADFAGTAAVMTANGIPYAETLLVPTIALEVGGGLALALNYHPALAAGALGLFLIPATLIFHDFWTFADPVVAMREQIQFMKNTAILGGLLAFVGQGDKD